LPFANLSGSPDAEYLSDGISTAVINLLSELSGVRVMARTTVFSYKGRLPVDPRRVGAELNVGVVLLGTVDQRNGRLKIGVELIATSDGSLLWGQEYDREMQDVLGLQREIAQRIAEQLHLKLSVDERHRLSARPSADVEAYQLYLKGYYALYTFTPEGLERSLDYFNKATAKHPGNALAYAGLVEAYFNLSFLSPPLEIWPKAKQSALRALELDSRLAEAHYAMALVSFCYDRDWQTAETEFRRAIDLKPGYAQAREWYAWSVLAQSARFDEALAEFRAALDLDPLSLAAHTDHGTCLYWAGRLEEAAGVLGHVLELEDRFYVAHLFLGLTLLKAGEAGLAISELRKAVTQSNNPVCIGFLGHALASVGETAEASALLRDLYENARQGYVPADAMGVIHVALGDLDQAFERMQAACDERTVVSLTLKVEPAFDRLRSDPRFGELLRRSGLDRERSPNPRPIR
jgi:TolB-like protein/Flp pilus assembly protein TadD